MCECYLRVIAISFICFTISGIMISLLIFKYLLQYNTQFTKNFIVRILNNLPIGFSGITLSQTLKQARKIGGRLNYYIYPNPHVYVGANLIPFAIKLTQDNTIEDIYIGASIKRSSEKYSNIGGYFDSQSNADIELATFLKNEYQIINNVRANQIYRPILFNQDATFFTKDTRSYDLHPLDNVLREVKEELHWHLQVTDIISRKPLIVTEYKKEDIKNPFFLLTNYFLTYVGVLNNEGQLIISDKNITIKNYSCKGYDDIQRVDFFPLSSIKNKPRFYEINKTQIHIEKISFEEAYKPSIIEILDHLCQTLYATTLFELNKNPTLKNMIEKFKIDCLDVENNNHLFTMLSTYNKN